MLDTLPVDVLACITSYGTSSELLLLRLISKTLKRKIDSDGLWSHRLVLASAVTGAHPPSSTASTGGTSVQWRDFALRHGLLRLPFSLGPSFGTWSVVGQSTPTLSRSQVNEAVQDVVEAIRPPQPLHRASATVSVGLYICASSPSTATEGATKKNAFATSIWPSVAAQVHQFLHLSPETAGRSEKAIVSMTDEKEREAEETTQPPHPTSAQNATLFVMNAFPYFPCVSASSQNQALRAQYQQNQGVFRTVLCAVDTGAPHQRRAAAEHFAALMHTCSLVHVIAETEADLVRFAQGIGSVLPPVEAAAFSTNSNTPTLVFNHGSSSNAKEVDVDLARVLQQCPASFQTWVLNRTCSVGTSHLAHKNLFSVTRSPYSVPSFASPGVTAAVGPATLIKMTTLFLADKSADFPRSRTVWDLAPTHLVKGHVGFHAAFYTNAMSTDFEEATRPSNGSHIYVTDSQCEALCVFERYRVLSTTVLHAEDRAPETEPEEHTGPDPVTFCTAPSTLQLRGQFCELLATFPLLPVPMDPNEMVETHSGHSYSALRRFAFALPAVCGPQTDKGLRQLEILKREVGDAFRTMWRRNNEYSRVYCNSLFTFVIAAPLFTKFFTDRYASQAVATVDRAVAATSSSTGSQLSNTERYGIQEKRGLVHFFRAAKDVIEEYILKSRGLRQFDILSERLADALIPAVLTFCTVHPHKHTPLDAVREACEELQRDVVKATAAYSQTVDGRLNEAQGESAIYTASLSNDWAAEAERAAILHMNQIQDEVEAWESACLARIRILLSPPTAAHRHHLGGGSSSMSGSQYDDGETPSTTHLGGERMSLGGSQAATADWSAEGGEGVSVELEGAQQQQRPTREELEEAEDEARRVEYEETRRQLLQQAMVSEANFRSQSARLSSRLASSSQHSKSFSVVRATAGASSSSSGPLVSKLKASIRKLLS